MRAMVMELTAALSSVSDLTWNEVGAKDEVRRPAIGAMLAAEDMGERSDTRALVDTAACGEQKKGFERSRAVSSRSAEKCNDRVHMIVCKEQRRGQRLPSSACRSVPLADADGAGTC